MSIEFKEKLNDSFKDWGKILTINELLLKVRPDLFEHDFLKSNSRLVFCVCPDDINRIDEVESVEGALTKNYNGEFHLGGLGAYPMGGVSGITAASHHPPDKVENGSRKDGNMIFFVSPHMGLIKNGHGDFMFGKLIRPGQEKITSSCGAMMGFLAALKLAESPDNFSITPDTGSIDPTRIVLHNDLINNYSNELKEMLAIQDENQQVVELFKLNYALVANKAKEMIKEFQIRERYHFKGSIAYLGGITINLGNEDLFLLKDLEYPSN